MRTHRHHLTAALAALIAWSGPVPLPATDYEVSDYLPLAVGNSWTFGHEWYLNEGDGLEDLDDRFIESNWPAYEATWGGRFTITVERTEVIGGKTYYVLSGMPSGGWPPAPPHFLAGKKLRWEGTSLVEHDGTGEQTFFRFDGSGGRGTGYTIPTTEDDDRVTSRVESLGRHATITTSISTDTTATDTTTTDISCRHGALSASWRDTGSPTSRKRSTTSTRPFPASKMHWTPFKPP